MAQKCLGINCIILICNYIILFLKLMSSFLSVTKCSFAFLDVLLKFCVCHFTAFWFYSIRTITETWLYYSNTCQWPNGESSILNEVLGALSQQYPILHTLVNQYPMLNNTQYSNGFTFNTQYKVGLLSNTQCILDPELDLMKHPI